MQFYECCTKIFVLYMFTVPWLNIHLNNHAVTMRNDLNEINYCFLLCGSEEDLQSILFLLSQPLNPFLLCPAPSVASAFFLPVFHAFGLAGCAWAYDILAPSSSPMREHLKKEHLKRDHVQRDHLKRDHFETLSLKQTLTSDVEL